MFAVWGAFFTLALFYLIPISAVQSLIQASCSGTACVQLLPCLRQLDLLSILPGFKVHDNAYISSSECILGLQTCTLRYWWSFRTQTLNCAASAVASEVKLVAKLHLT